jgi:3-oxoacyl-[acyl-carrier-protein] synthase II
MGSPTDVALTGWGIVSPLGVGRQAFAAALAEGRSGVRLLQAFDGRELTTRLAAEAPDFEPKAYVRPRKSLKVMSRDIQMAFAAADMAWSHAGLGPGLVDPDRCGVTLGADMIMFELEEAADAFRASMQEGRLRRELWGTKSIPELYPLWMLKYLPNMAACHVSIALDLRGPNNTIALGEVSSLLALGEAARVIERGWADVMLAGGLSGRVHPTVMAFRQRYELSRREDDPAAAVRPFDADRDGQVHGEGAAVFVLESRRHAEARRAQPLAWLVGQASHCEPQNGDRKPRGVALRHAIAGGLRSAHLEPRQLGHVNADGLSTRHDDAVEAQAIRELLGDVPVTAFKSYFGTLGAASGAVELSATLVAFETRQIPRTLNYGRPDPACPVNVVREPGQPLGPATALILNQAPTGQAASLVVGAGGDG